MTIKRILGRCKDRGKVERSRKLAIDTVARNNADFSEFVLLSWRPRPIERGTEKYISPSSLSSIVSLV